MHTTLTGYKEMGKSATRPNLDEVSLEYVYDLFGATRASVLMRDAGIEETSVEAHVIKKTDLWQICISSVMRYNDEGHGALTRELPMNSWSMINASVSQMPNLSKGLKKFVELVPLLQCGINARITTSGRDLKLSIFATDALSNNTRVERYIEVMSAYFQSFIGWTTGRDWLPVEIRLSSLLDDQEGSILTGISGCTYTRHGTGVTFTYQQSDLDLHLGVRPVDRWVVYETQIFNKVISGRVTRQTIEPSLVKNVRALLDEGLSCQNQIADRLHISVPTLQRHLAHLGTNFREVSREQRSKRLLLLLATTMSLDDIAQELGFSDRRSLTRASKEWLGVTPSQYRFQIKATCR